MHHPYLIGTAVGVTLFNSLVSVINVNQDGQIVISVLIITGFVVKWWSDKKQAGNVEKLVEAKHNEVTSKLEVIRIDVNSNMQKALTRIAELEEQVKHLKGKQ